MKAGAAAAVSLLGACAVFVAVALALVPASALADGDPASDVLAAQEAFVPADADATPARQAQLLALTSSASRAGIPVRVALIASREDLGSVGELWLSPQRYAQFLGEELSLLFHGSVLVVMPSGYGIYRIGGPTLDAKALAGLARPGSAKALAPSGARAVELLAAAANLHLAVTAPSRETAPAHAQAGEIGWLAFWLGCLPILISWTASLRARPVVLRRHGRSPRPSP